MGQDKDDLTKVTDLEEYEHEQTEEELQGPEGHFQDGPQENLKDDLQGPPEEALSPEDLDDLEAPQEDPLEDSQGHLQDDLQEDPLSLSQGHQEELQEPYQGQDQQGPQGEPEEGPQEELQGELQGEFQEEFPEESQGDFQALSEDSSEGPIGPSPELQEEPQEELQELPEDPPENPQGHSPPPPTPPPPSSESLQNFGQQVSQYEQQVKKELPTITPAIPKGPMGLEDIQQQAKKLVYAPSAQGLGPLFGLIVQGDLKAHQDAIQSLLQEYETGIDLKAMPYGPLLESGKIILTRLTEYMAIGLFIGLEKFPFRLTAQYMDEIVPDEQLEDVEARGLPSALNPEQNTWDQGQFAQGPQEVLIIKAAGAPGYKLLARCGILEKSILMKKSDFEGLQFDLEGCFEDPFSPTLMDEWNHKMLEGIKAHAISQRANAVVNFQVKITHDFDSNQVLLQYSGDLLLIRKVDDTKSEK